MVRCKNCFWVSLCSGATYIFLFLSILTSGYDLILGSFFDFLGLQGTKFGFFGDFVLEEYFLYSMLDMGLLLQTWDLS